MLTRSLLAAVFGCFSLSPAVLAAESAYTSVAPKDCRTLKQGEAFTSVRCTGHGGMQVLVDEGDLRFSVSYGPRAAQEPAATQTFHPLQSIGDKVEWRMEGGKPFATILRWRMGFDEPADRREILVVTRLLPGPVCWVALIDARANPDPNVLARKVADEQARAFTCGTKPAFVGERTPGIEELVND
jgi:hypothetical protein